MAYEASSAGKIRRDQSLGGGAARAGVEGGGGGVPRKNSIRSLTGWFLTVETTKEYRLWMAAGDNFGAGGVVGDL